jgi:hypothetical protein
MIYVLLSLFKKKSINLTVNFKRIIKNNKYIFIGASFRNVDQILELAG